jgi:hypothetical protein
MLMLLPHPVRPAKPVYFGTFQIGGRGFLNPQTQPNNRLGVFFP